MIASVRNIAIVGLGNVGIQLLQAFNEIHFPVKQVYNRNQETAVKFAKEMNAEAISDLKYLDVDLCIVSVSDSAVAEVISQIPSHIKVAYTSGSVQLKDIERKKDVGVFYPLQTFTKDRAISLFEVPFFIEANDTDFAQQLFDLAWKISRKVQFMNSENRKEVHLAAVFINNFVNHQIHIAEKLSERYKFDIELLYPLLQETVSKALDKGAKEAQTGPAKRNDQNVIQAHLEMLDESDKKVYQVISESIIKTYYDKL